MGMNDGRTGLNEFSPVLLMSTMTYTTIRCAPGSAGTYLAVLIFRYGNDQIIGC